jgi:FHS family L-fucose permease-like MFS transporter
MVIFVTSRFICTFLLKYVSPGGLLLALALAGGGLTLGVIFIPGIVGLYCLVGISACMSLMFPTIYGIALKGVGEDAKLGAAGLIMAILGGSVMPPVQGAIIDLETVGLAGLSFPAVRVSFVLVVICFAVIAHYGWRTSSVHDRAT